MALPEPNSKPRLIREKARFSSALTASLALHGFLIVGLTSLCVFNRPQPFIIRDNFVSGAPVISLQTIVLVSPASMPDHPVPTQAAFPELGALPFAGPTGKAAPASKGKIDLPGQKITTTSATGAGIKHLRPASDKYVTSYALGETTFPHPPTPAEAPGLPQTRVVRMMIHFNAQGDVVEARIAQSSGVASLDAETQTYIAEHWHSQTYAGQSVSVPVEYKLTSL